MYNLMQSTTAISSPPMIHTSNQQPLIYNLHSNSSGPDLAGLHHAHFRHQNSIASNTSIQMQPASFIIKNHQFQMTNYHHQNHPLIQQQSHYKFQQSSSSNKPQWSVTSTASSSVATESTLIAKSNSSQALVLNGL
jgi:hypothetical protein